MLSNESSIRTTDTTSTHCGEGIVNLKSFPIGIRFFTNRMDQNVAYTTHGKGPWLVVPAWWVSHLELDWEDDDYRQFFSQLAEHHTVVRYDRPGVGMSDHHRSSYTLEDEVNTLEDLIDHLAIEQCSLLGISCGGPVAAAFAHGHKNYVQKLVFLGSFAQGSDTADPFIQQALCSLVSAHWGMGAKTILDLFDPQMPSDQRTKTGRKHKKSASPQMAEALLKLTFSMDVRSILQTLELPALVIHRQKDQTIHFEAGKQLATLLPDAQLLSVPGDAHLPWAGERQDTIVSAIVNFTAGSAPTDEQDENIANQFRLTGDVWTICFNNKCIYLKQARGLQDIARLLDAKGEELHVLGLAAEPRDDMGMQASRPDDLHAGTTESNLLDEQAIAAYRQRLSQLATDKDAAAAIEDEAVYALLEQEEEQLLQVLSQGLGLGGRRRVMNSPAEKARKAVSARIKSSIQRIGQTHPELAEHLSQSIMTGTYCRYNPQYAIHWRT